MNNVCLEKEVIVAEYPIFVLVIHTKNKDTDTEFIEYTWQKIKNQKEYNSMAITLKKLNLEENESFIAETYYSFKIMIGVIMEKLKFNWILK